ncbi:hypothetical protein AAHA92_12275 [Salvia divinorum]|uniref:Uncharacterized protein n=1 Tax=Salvia divinorum TaxID=28513 RepID=A0ABD1HJS0_SALDI
MRKRICGAATLPWKRAGKRRDPQRRPQKSGGGNCPCREEEKRDRAETEKPRRLTSSDEQQRCTTEAFRFQQLHTRDGSDDYLETSSSGCTQGKAVAAGIREKLASSNGPSRSASVSSKTRRNPTLKEQAAMARFQRRIRLGHFSLSSSSPPQLLIRALKYSTTFNQGKIQSMIYFIVETLDVHPDGLHEQH